MAAVTAAMVKELRESTGAGMMECKKALTETDGDMEAAVDVLRKSGAAKVEKKAGRIAAEGITRVASDGNTAVVVEVNSETDFVAKNATFQEFVQAVADKALKAPVDKAGDGEDVCAILGMQSELEEKTLTIGEKLSLRRFQKITGDCVASYIHGGGRIGVLVAADGASNDVSFRSENTDYHGLISTAEYDVPLELMRFFTGFGVRKFNYNKVKGQDWVDSVLYKMEVTPLAEKLEGEAWIGAYIGNWDAKGHRLSLKLKYYPDEEHRVYNTLPLFNTVNYLEQAGQPYPIFMRQDSLIVKFTLKEPAKNARLYYLTTGHGGWGGGDEFNQKPNTLYLDGEKVISFVPWRDDCGTYRNWNPCSGNFSNGLSSSDLSRSNWCPGTVTNPEYIYLGDLEAGEHSITVKIPQGAPEGGSNSYWCISGTLIY